MTARISFEHELSLLNADLKQMGELIEKAFDQTAHAFEDQDYELAEDIIKGDRAINDMEKSIESRCLSLMLRQQPVAKDLRVVSTALKIVTDMERIGDHASDIAELILRFKGENMYHAIKHIPRMITAAKEMVNGALKAFINQDIEAAHIIIKQDDIVDDLFNKVKQEVINLLKETPDYSDQGIDLLMIAKYLERVGDHAVNICEWTEFNQTGSLKNVRIL